MTSCSRCARRTSSGCSGGWGRPAPPRQTWSSRWSRRRSAASRRRAPRPAAGTDMVSLARKNLLHDRLRFAITVAGVAFAVTLVLVQVGLFMGLLAKATVTIEHASADIWVTSKNTPNVDFAHTFPETAVLRVRGVPGVARADNLIIQFMNIQLPNGAEEGSLVYALEDFRAWNLPWTVNEGNVEDLKRGAYVLLDRSAERR